MAEFQDPTLRRAAAVPPDAAQLQQLRTLIDAVDRALIRHGARPGQPETFRPIRADSLFGNNHPALRAITVDPDTAGVTFRGLEQAGKNIPLLTRLLMATLGRPEQRALLALLRKEGIDTLRVRYDEASRAYRGDQ